LSLTRRQKWRIEKIQAERIARANKASNDSEDLLDDETKAQTGLVITRYGQRLLVEAESGDCTNAPDGVISSFLLLAIKLFFKRLIMTKAWLPPYSSVIIH